MRIIARIILAFVVITSAQADEDKVAQFNQAYRAYQDAFDKRQYQEAIPHAERALALAEDFFTDKPEQLATMTYNLGDLYVWAYRLDKAIDTLELAETRYRAAFGDDDPRVVDPLLSLGGVYDRLAERKALDRARHLYMEALEIYEAHFGRKHPMLSEPLRRLAYNAMRAGNRKSAEKFLRRALSYTEGADSEFLGQHGLNLLEFGKAKMKERSLGLARDYLHKAADVFEGLDPVPTHVLSVTHACLIEVYERLGESDRATEHVQYLARMEPEADTREPEPLFRVAQEYPASARERGYEGFVILLFDIDVEGRVKDPEIIDGENVRVFEDAAMEAIRRYRFKPRIVEGELVEAKNQIMRLIWKMN